MGKYLGATTPVASSQVFIILGRELGMTRAASKFLGRQNENDGKKVGRWGTAKSTARNLTTTGTDEKLAIQNTYGVTTRRSIVSLLVQGGGTVPP